MVQNTHITTCNTDFHSINKTTILYFISLQLETRYIATMEALRNPILVALGVILLTSSLIYCRPLKREINPDGKFAKLYYLLAKVYISCKWVTFCAKWLQVTLSKSKTC